MLRKQLLIMLLCVALTLVAFGLANAGLVYYVTQSGSDDEPTTGGHEGDSWATAFLTIQWAIDHCNDNTVVDTINVRAGASAYVENIVFDDTPDPVHGGMGYKYITLQGHTKYGSAPVIDGNDAGSVISILTGSTHITIRNFKITNGSAEKGGGIYIDHMDKASSTIDNYFHELEITGNTARIGGGLYANYSKFHMENCCIHENLAKNDYEQSGPGHGGGLYLSNPGGSTDENDPWLGYRLRDCVVFHNLADVNGGGIYLDSDMNYSMIFNCLIRQNVIGVADESGGLRGAGLHYKCAMGYIKNCTIADNYHYDDVDHTGGVVNWAKIPLWGNDENGQPPACGASHEVYGVYASYCDGCFVRMIHDIVYFNGPTTYDDVEDQFGTEIEAWYCDIYMPGGSGVTYTTKGSSQNKNVDPLFVKSDDFGSYACNSTLYFLKKIGGLSPCVNAGFKDDDDDPNSWKSAGGENDPGKHCDLVNTTTANSSSGKTPEYSVHRDGSEDVDYYCDTGDNNGTVDMHMVDMGYHYRALGITYIELDWLSAEVHAGKVVVKWETATEIDNAGFLVYRCDNEASDCHKVSNFIAADGDAVGGATYSFTDANVAAGAGYYYYLVDIDTSGEWTAHGPVFARIPNIVEPILRLPKLEALVR